MQKGWFDEAQNPLFSPPKSKYDGQGPQRDQSNEQNGQPSNMESQDEFQSSDNNARNNIDHLNNQENTEETLLTRARNEYRNGHTNKALAQFDVPTLQKLAKELGVATLTQTGRVSKSAAAIAKSLGDNVSFIVFVCRPHLN